MKERTIIKHKDGSLCELKNSAQKLFPERIALSVENITGVAEIGRAVIDNFFRLCYIVYKQ